MDNIEIVKEEIKIKRIALGLLEKERNETCYIANKESIKRKKEKILEEIKALEESIQSQSSINIIK